MFKVDNLECGAEKIDNAALVNDGGDFYSLDRTQLVPTGEQPQSTWCGAHTTRNPRSMHGVSLPFSFGHR